MALFVFHSSFSQLSSFLRSLSQGYTAVLYQLALDHRQLNPWDYDQQNEDKKLIQLF